MLKGNPPPKLRDEGLLIDEGASFCGSTRSTTQKCSLQLARLFPLGAHNLKTLRSLWEAALGVRG